MRKIAVRAVVTLAGVIGLLGLNLPAASAASEGDQPVAAAMASAKRKLAGYDTVVNKPLTRVAGGAVYARLLVGHELYEGPNGLDVKVRVVVVPTKRSAEYRHAVTIFVDELYDDAGAAKRTDDRRTGTYTWSFNKIAGADMKIWASQDVRGKESDAKSPKILVDYLS